MELDIAKILLVGVGIVFPFALFSLYRILKENDERWKNFEKWKAEQQETCKDFAVIKDRCDRKNCK